MTSNELLHYFGTTDFHKIKDMYEIGTLRKVPSNKILTRMFEFGKNNEEDYVFEAMGSEINLKMQKNNLLGKIKTSEFIKHEKFNHKHCSVKESQYCLYRC